MAFWILMVPATLLGALAAGFVFLLNASTTGNWLRLGAAFSEYRCDGCQSIFVDHLTSGTEAALLAALVSVVSLAAVLKLFRIRSVISAAVLLLGATLVSALVLSSGSLYVPNYFSQLWVLIAPALFGSVVFVLVLLPALRSRHVVLNVSRG